MFNKSLALFLVFFAASSSFAQTWDTLTLSFQPNLAWAGLGGTNAPQFSSLDFDGDGLPDLAVFDRASGSWSLLQGQTTADSFIYIPRPHWALNFPRLERWALLRDYNCDGLPDIFAWQRNELSGQTGIAVWQAERQGTELRFRPVLNGGLLRFQPETNSPLRFNLFVSNIDLPAIEDMDGDGDLDILNFSIGGGYVEYFRNLSVESGWACDSLQFRLADNCWGRFYESGLTEAITLSNRPDSCANFPNWSLPRSLHSPRHAGSTLLALDIDSDGNKDLILGDLSFDNITLLHNGGNNQTAFMVAQDTFFPSYDQAYDLPTFPAAFYVDIDHDGKRDLLVAPNADDIAANTQVWYYRNTGTDAAPIFRLAEQDFISRRAWDWGSQTAFAWGDLNGDGRADLLVGTDGAFETSGQNRSSLLLLTQNAAGVLVLADTNFANLQGSGIRRPVPSLGDIDGDGDLDLILGLADGRLLFLPNRGTAQNPVFDQVRPDYLHLQPGLHLHPQWFDVNGDGLLDLVIGERNGNTNLFINRGTASQAVFQAQADSETFGLIDTKPPGRLEGNSAPFLCRIQNRNLLFMGTELGQVELYEAPADWSGAFQRLNPNFEGLAFAGRQSNLALMAQNGQFIAVLGNRRGGLQSLRFNPPPPLGLSPSQAQNPSSVYPNPLRPGQQLCLQSPYPIQRLELRHAWSGALLQTWTENCQTLRSDLTPGLYLLDIQSEKRREIMKIILY